MCKVNDKTFIFEQIEENIPGIIYRFIIDDIGKFRFTYISKSIQEIYKVKPEIVINSQQNLNDYISSNEIDSLNQSIETAYLNKSVWEWKGSITIGKITRVISTKAKLDKNEDGKKVWTGFAFDITEQENLKKEIHSKDKKIRALAHNFPGIIYEWVYNKNKTFGFNYVSNKVKDILGLEPNQMIKIYSMLKPNELDRFINSIEHCAENQLDWNFKTEVYLKNGQKKHIEFIATPSQKTNGQLFYSGIIFDITETKNYEDKIHERQQVILETQKMAKIGSWEFFLDQRHLIWTEEMFRIFEIDPNTKNLLSEYFKKLHPEDKSSVSNMLTNPSFNDEINYLEYKILLDDNRVKYVSATIKPVKNDKGHVYKFWGTTQDITDIKNKEFELIKAKNESEKANRAKSDFLSNMSHELRTPINAVIGVSNLLLQESPKPEQINNLNILKFSSQNLLILINDILDFSKIEAGKIEFEETSFSLKNLVDNIKSVFSNITSEKNILIDLHFDKSIPEYIIGDSARLAQIINNLMSNAVKFTQKGSIKINISLKEKKDNLFFINFSIEDTGIGIPENKINYIFENFTQASSETNRKFGGTGLGLAITKKLIELQNGEIFVESKLHEGSKFSFILGFKESINISKNINTNIFETKSLKGLKILLVDDNKINTIIAIQFLKKWDIDVDTAINGVLAVDKIINNHYDVVLMDLQMPEMDGYEATKKIREINEDYFKNLPIIALTASATIEIREKCKKVGINDFITKPFNPDELHKKLSEYITNRVNN